MDREEIYNRIEDLINVYAYTNIHDEYLSVNQRICLSQERASWMTVLEHPYPETQAPRYVIPKHLEMKFRVVKSIIIQIKWKRPEYQKDPY